VAQFGYALVSTDGQSLTAQVAELKEVGCTEIFQEKVSGAKSDRKQLARVIDRLCEGDVLVVTRLDRLSRSTRDLLNVLGGLSPTRRPASNRCWPLGPILPRRTVGLC
jgi:DNA invertase Pin-like site-specific DNA recombinase